KQAVDKWLAYEKIKKSQAWQKARARQILRILDGTSHNMTLDQAKQLIITIVIDVNTKNKDGNTALIYSSFKGYKGIAELLINKGADINAKNRYGSTALILASDRGYKEVVELLI